MALLKPIWMQPSGADGTLYYSGIELRQLAQAIFPHPGVVGLPSLVVAQRAAGANFSVDIAAGQCVVTGDDVAGQGSYVCTNTAGAYNLVTPSAPGSGTRYHRVVAQVRDKTSNGTWTTYDWIPVLVQDTGSGFPAEPPSALTLAQVAITTGQVSVLNANITDMRPVIGQSSQDAMATGQTVSSTSPVAITGMSIPVAASTYHVYGKIWGLQGATTAVQAVHLATSGSAVASAVRLDWRAANYGTETLLNYNVATSLATNMTTASMTNGYSFTITFDGIITFSAGGTLIGQCACITSGSDTWSLLSPSYLRADPM